MDGIKTSEKKRAAPESAAGHLEKKPKSGDEVADVKAKMEAITRKNQETSPLLRLPAELRNRIYELAIGGYEIHPETCSESDTLDMDCRQYNSSEKTTMSWDKLFNLSYTCCQLHAETKLLPYQLSIFQITYAGWFDYWLSIISEEQLECITTVSFKGVKNLSTIDTIPERLDECTGLERLICYDSLGRDARDCLKEFVRSRKGLQWLNEKGNTKVAMFHDLDPFGLDREMEEYTGDDEEIFSAEDNLESDQDFDSD
ncbi:hypothetical protein P153DRAFT_382296 [Dothidotthia symphoricarpi CBS 119687]|uniref:F-box domain-containing protein n=1 Tax=Dothidotthia symphoricarpi CBS 119687 TaxID=1392245 RepID=A0A6A6ANF7_9PLEO|nr:uncharacterized protein P153DRAFT_382296 [Dothidotthia symphoricarpi CBS 119687]KAF2132678.1 hypothetical protein P153DRAFT_382296 [Dothidotthia symphoricarpi CBS 119687]